MRRLAASATFALLLLAACGEDDGGAVAVEDDATTTAPAGGDETGDEATGDEPVEEAGFTVQLTGAAEVPGPGSEEGAGDASLVLGEGEACVEATVTLEASPMAMHIHEASETEAGPVVVDFGPKTSDDGWSICVEADQALLDDIAADPSGYYLNVHNADFPDGAVRAQLG